jgi:hypothetical protein
MSARLGGAFSTDDSSALGRGQQARRVTKPQNSSGALPFEWVGYLAEDEQVGILQCG